VALQKKRLEALSKRGLKQLDMLAGFYTVNDIAKTTVDVKQIVDKRRTGAEISEADWEELCNKLSSKYEDDVLAYDDDDL
jgi:hypothetical protein